MPRTIDIPVPNLRGQLAVVTGASDGIGLAIAARLVRAGAEVIMPVRNIAKGHAAAERIRERGFEGEVDIRALDLASLASVAELADDLLRDGRPINLLVNNAGVMSPPTRQLSPDGYELQFATNHLGHFALTTRLLPLLRAGEARVTTQLSVAAKRGTVRWDDITWERGYHPMKAYRSSKIAVGLFAMELHRRSASNGWGIESNVCHPGVSPTNLLAAQPQMGRPKDSAGVKAIRALSRHGILVGTIESGALPAVYAATSPHATSGHLYGPDGFQHLRGEPAEQDLYATIRSADDGRRIWELSDHLVGTVVPT